MSPLREDKSTSVGTGTQKEQPKRPQVAEKSTQTDPVADQSAGDSMPYAV